MIRKVRRLLFAVCVLAACCTPVERAHAQGMWYGFGGGPGFGFGPGFGWGYDWGYRPWFGPRFGPGWWSPPYPWWASATRGSGAARQPVREVQAWRRERQPLFTNRGGVARREPLRIFRRGNRR